MAYTSRQGNYDLFWKDILKREASLNRLQDEWLILDSLGFRTMFSLS